MKRLKLIVILGFLAVLGYTVPVFAQTCDPNKEECPPTCDPEKEECKPPPKAICHNIGGPDAKGGGANCDPNTVDECCIETEEIGELCIDSTQYFGIVISASDNAAASHIRHGDGEATTVFDPALHLSSEGQNHHGANVECVADRVNEQDPEPGN